MATVYYVFFVLFLFLLVFYSNYYGFLFSPTPSYRSFSRSFSHADFLLWNIFITTNAARLFYNFFFCIIKSVPDDHVLENMHTCVITIQYFVFPHIFFTWCVGVLCLVLILNFTRLWLCTYRIYVRVSFSRVNIQSLVDPWNSPTNWFHAC